MQGEIFNEGDFACGECHWLSALGDRVADGVHGDIADRHHGLRLTGAPADECPNAREQLSQFAGLWQIVICTAIEPAHSLPGAMTCGEHEHRGMFVKAQPFEHLKAIHHRHHHIQYNGVVIPHHRFCEAVLAIARFVDSIAVLTQRFGEAAE